MQGYDVTLSCCVSFGLAGTDTIFNGCAFLWNFYLWSHQYSLHLNQSFDMYIVVCGLVILTRPALYSCCRYALTKAFCVAFVLTFFSIFDVPVFWPILLLYWVVLFVLTMKRQIRHMIKYHYVPFSLGKQVCLFHHTPASFDYLCDLWVSAPIRTKYMNSDYKLLLQGYKIVRNAKLLCKTISKSVSLVSGFLFLTNAT